MSKIKVLIICVSLFALFLTPRNVNAAADVVEPSFHSSINHDKNVSRSSLEGALSKHGLDQAGHGILILAIVGFLALRKR